jgi:hypothetical protein
VDLAPELLAAGHHYFLRLALYGGTPYASSGDFTTTSFPAKPYAAAVRDSTIFVVN